MGLNENTLIAVSGGICNGKCLVATELSINVIEGKIIHEG